MQSTLPRTFEEFDDARRQSFMTVMDYKESGGKLVGYLCSYTPLEVIDAAGAASVALCGMSDETIPAAETVLPANLCPLIKSTYGFALTQKCPFTYFADLIVGETTCDGKKKMYELMADLKETYVLHLPQGRTRVHERAAWREEVRLFKEALEHRFGTSIAEDDLRAAVRKRNRLRRALVEMYRLQEADVPAMSGVEMISTMLAGTFSFDIASYTEQLEMLVRDRRAARDQGESPVSSHAKRILLTGCPEGGVVNKVGRTIEENGGVIVCMDDCSGERTNSMLVDEDAPDILAAIADRYLDIDCSVMTPNGGRVENLLAKVEEY